MKVDLRAGLGMQLEHNVAHTRVVSDSLHNYLVDRYVDTYELGGFLWLGGNNYDSILVDVNGVMEKQHFPLKRYMWLGWYETEGPPDSLSIKDFNWFPQRVFYQNDNGGQR
jgi:hypothetical protein